MIKILIKILFYALGIKKETTAFLTELLTSVTDKKAFGKYMEKYELTINCLQYIFGNHKYTYHQTD